MVRVQPDGDGPPAEAIAQVDYAYWTEGNLYPEWELGLGLIALGLAVLGPTIWYAWAGHAGATRSRRE